MTDKQLETVKEDFEKRFVTTNQITNKRVWSYENERYWDFVEYIIEKQVEEAVRGLEKYIEDIKYTANGRYHPMVDDLQDRLDMTVDYCEDLEAYLKRRKENPDTKYCKCGNEIDKSKLVCDEFTRTKGFARRLPEEMFGAALVLHGDSKRITPHYDIIEACKVFAKQ